MDSNSACHICGGTMKADDNTTAQIRCDKCGHQEIALVDGDGKKEAVKMFNRNQSRRSH